MAMMPLWLLHLVANRPEEVGVGPLMVRGVGVVVQRIRLVEEEEDRRFLWLIECNVSVM